MEPDEPFESPHRPRLGDRSLFPDLKARAYLAHAGVSPLSLPVRAAVTRYLDDYAAQGLAASATWEAQRRRLKDKLASLMAVRGEDLALTSSTTSAVTAIAMSFPWRAGDKVVLFESEFPTNITPWQRAAELFGLELVFLPVADFARPHAPDFAKLERTLQRGVRLVAVSAVQFQTGIKMPLPEISERAHRYGAQVFVDAIQALGLLMMDASGFDYVAGGSHKWLMGPEGLGFLYVHPDRVGDLRPHLAGWRSHEDAFDFLFKGEGHLRYDRPFRKRADFLEGGAPPGLQAAGLEAAVDLLLELGPPRIFNHVERYLDTLEYGLKGRGFRSLRLGECARRGGILSVIAPLNLPAPAIAGALGRRGYAVTAPDGLLRFAPHWPNDPAEIPDLLTALDEAVAEVKADL